MFSSSGLVYRLAVTRHGTCLNILNVNILKIFTKDPKLLVLPWIIIAYFALQWEPYNCGGAQIIVENIYKSSRGN